MSRRSYAHLPDPAREALRVIRKHKTLWPLVEAELAKSAPRPRYFWGLATAGRDQHVDDALRELCRALT